MRFIIHRFLHILLSIILIVPEYCRIFGQPIYQVLIILALLLSLLEKRKIKANKILFILKRILIMMMLYILPRIIHFDIKPIISCFIIPVLLILVFYVFIDSYKDLDDTLEAFLDTGLIMIAFSLVEFFTKFNIFSLIENVDLGAIGSTPYYRNDIIRVESSFGTAISCGIYMVFINVVSIYMIVCKKKRTKYYVSYLFSLLVAFLTQSRMPIITIALVQIMSFRFLDRRLKYIICFIIPVLLFVDLLTYQEIWESILKYYNLFRAIVFRDNSAYDLTAEYRLMLFSTLLPYVKENIVFGHGQSYMTSFTFRVWQYVFTSIDNNYLYVLLQYGITGLIAQLFPFLLVIFYEMKKDRSNYSNRFILIITITYLLNLISVCEMSENRAFYFFVALVIWEKYKQIEKNVLIKRGAEWKSNRL